jgi:CheY-like chemotaxis protein
MVGVVMSEVVLIVDDDPVQRRLVEAMVQRFGYRALTADGGDAAHIRPPASIASCSTW